MNSLRTALIIVIVALCAGWLLFGRPPATSDDENASDKRRSKAPNLSPTQAKRIRPQTLKPTPPSTVQIAPPQPALPQEPKTVVKKTESRDPHQLPPHSVPFELINGFVVTYGDILLGKPARQDFPKSGFIEEPKLKYWEDGEIPFSIHATVRNPERILRVINYYNENTPVHFVPYTGQADNIVFVPLAGHCLSYLGKIGGNQPIYLDDRCGEHEITHEVMHAIGFIHEHSRADRDRYVQVLWNNIDEANQEQFDVTPEDLNAPLKGRPFDYHSIMLYSPSAFAHNPNQPTLQSLTEQAIEPVTNALSSEDLYRVQRLYASERK